MPIEFRSWTVGDVEVFYRAAALLDAGVPDALAGRLAPAQTLLMKAIRS